MIANHIDAVHVLVVSHEPAVLRMLGSEEASKAWHLETASNGWEAMERVQSGTASQLLVLDVSLNDAEPMHFMRWLSCFRPDFPVVLLCCPDDADRVKEATGLDGESIVFKPFDTKRLDKVIQRHLDRTGNGYVDTGSKNIEPLGQGSCFVSASLIMQKLRVQAALLAKTDVPVLIVGEKGTGKYTVASLIHKLSVRSGFKLLRVNCGAMPEAVLEAELFGDRHVAASRQMSLGKFAAGEKGTILLEEISEMPAGVQSKLLQVLQNNELDTAAGADLMPANVRILATSSTNLDRVLAAGQLREDLYHRLSAFTLQVPSLRQRKDEIATLLRYFMHNLARHYGLPPRGFSSSMLTACQHYSWPGNLKEMEAFVKRYLVAGDHESMLSEIAMDPVAGVDNGSVSISMELGPTPGEKSRTRHTEPKSGSLKSLVQDVKSEAERNAIGAALMRTGWNRKAAARLLKVSYRTMLYKIEQYKMRAPQPYLSPLPAGEFPAYAEVKGNGKAS